ncbi:MAG: hypothetical protein GTO40_29415 [Deltaproteobacteria bacterium]|nr:hypothetical protein [Deltaproteobacteria bacterium]
MVKGESIFLFIVAVLTLCFMGLGVSYGKDASLIPWTVGTTLLALVVCQVVRVTRDGTIAKLTSGAVLDEFRQHALIVGGAFFACGVILLGGLIAMAVIFPWLYIGFAAKKWLMGLIVGFVLGGLIYLLGWLLEIPFPEPLIATWLTGPISE